MRRVKNVTVRLSPLTRPDMNIAGDGGELHLLIDGEWKTIKDGWRHFTGAVTIDATKLCELFDHDGQTLGHGAFKYFSTTD